MKLKLLSKDLIAKRSPDLSRPFGFYSGYIGLSSMQQESVAEQIIVTYYKCIITDLIEANEHLKSQVEEI